MKELYRDKSRAAAGGIMLIAALLFVLQVGFAPAQGQSAAPADADKHSDIVPEGTEFDYSCTTGPSGHCEVQYVDLDLSGEEAEQLCGTGQCWVRIEFRW